MSFDTPAQCDIDLQEQFKQWNESLSALCFHKNREICVRVTQRA